MFAVEQIPAVREGDFIETSEGLIFDVKGLVHPPDRAIAFLRYYPVPDGNRLREGKSFKKVYHLAERYDILRQQFPHYLYYDPVFGRELQGVPSNYLHRIYQPSEALLRLENLAVPDSLQQDVITFAKIITQKSRIPFEKVGISGSVQVGLHGPTSDIDLIVYGKKHGRAVQLALRRAHHNPEQGIAGYNLNTYQTVYNLRWSASGIPVETMLQIDGRKALHGTFGGHHYFIRVVLDWDEIQEQYGDRTYNQIGYARARCRITNHSDSIFTPCRYEIDKVEIINGSTNSSITEITSFRGRFCEQVKQDDEVIVQGTVEEVYTENKRWTRFLLGDHPEDILIPRKLF